MSQKYEKQQAGEIVIQNRFVKWLDNFWYHYKWHTIAVLFFLFVFLVCFVQCSSSSGVAEVQLVYVGGYDPDTTLETPPNQLTKEERQGILTVLSWVAPPMNGEEASPSVDLREFYVYDDEQIKGFCYDPQADKVHTPSADQMKLTSAQNMDQFVTYSLTGDSSVWFVSEAVYQTAAFDRSRIRPLTELYATVPESAYDGYAIRLSDTDLYRYYTAFQALPEDTLIVMPHSMVWGESSDGEVYAEFLKLYHAIVDFQKP